MGSARDGHALDWFSSVLSTRYFSSAVFLSDWPIDSTEVAQRNIPREIFYDYRPLWGASAFLTRMRVLPPALRRATLLMRLLCMIIQLKRTDTPYLFHAYSMSYALVCAVAGVNFIAMPQGSDLLVGPRKNTLLKAFAKFSMSRAWIVATSSPSLQEQAMSFGARATVNVQNGISLKQTSLARNRSRGRHRVTSIRVMSENYRVLDILKARNNTLPDQCLSLTFPEADSTYSNFLAQYLSTCDETLGRLGKKSELFQLYSESIACISIPRSDASPRSVYEAIFCGAVVLTCPSSWVEILPHSMRSRIVIVNLRRPDWLPVGLAQARKITENTKFFPCADAISKYTDQGATRAFFDQLFEPRA